MYAASKKRICCMEKEGKMLRGEVQCGMVDNSNRYRKRKRVMKMNTTSNSANLQHTYGVHGFALDLTWNKKRKSKSNTTTHIITNMHK